MKKHITLLVFLTAYLFGQSQNLIINYDYYYKKSDSPVSMQKQSILEITPYNSLYKIIMSSTGFASNEKIEHQGNIIKVIGESKPRFTFKDFKTNTFVNTEKILLTDFVVSDSLNIFKWKIQNDQQKTILGYRCNKALLNYRGRNYEAFYTVEIPIQNGPWKFHGLPGLILEIKTIDTALDFKITATKIEINANNLNTENPYKNEKIHTWNEYLNIYKKKYKDLSNYSGENGTSVSIPKAKIEVMVED